MGWDVEGGEGGVKELSWFGNGWVLGYAFGVLTVRYGLSFNYAFLLGTVRK